MEWVSAPNIEDAPLPPGAAAEWRKRLEQGRGRLESWLERERGQLSPWFVVGFGGGIAAWFWLSGPNQWAGFLCVAAGLALAGWSARAGRAERALGWFGLALCLGCGLIWLRADSVAAPRLERPAIASFSATVERVETLAAKGDLRLTLAPQDDALPPRVRVSIAEKDAPAGIGAGAIIELRARLQPPPPMALPGSHDFARDAWFRGIGGVGRAIGPLTVVKPAPNRGLDAARASLDRHVRAALPGSSGTIATALATGDQGAVSKADAEAMRRSGLTHLLSVSGLHITAVVGAAMFLTLRLLALSERLALRFNLVLVSAAGGALAGIGYTLLTGAQVPTVRSCIAALLVLAGIALGRDAISLRLIAVGALVVLIFRPEAIAGASFQLSFAAVTAIVALHSLPSMRALFQRRDEGMIMRLVRAIGALLLTGLAVEAALIPLALYHFHRAGLYGVAANIVAIPLTTFVIMPLEAGALLLDTVGLGAPLWAATGIAIDLLLGMAHAVANASGAVAMLPAMPRAAFGLIIIGGLWLCLWTTRARLFGLIPAAIGALWAAATPLPDLLVTGDGRHLALVGADGTPALLRDRTGEFVSDLIGEAAAYDGELGFLAASDYASCSRDACVARVERGGHSWHILATRSATFMDWRKFIAACADADIVIADRKLPAQCAPRWLKLDRLALAETGGLAIRFDEQPHVDSVAARIGQHPWAMPASPRLSATQLTRFPPDR
jgi:competence protein ComEC